MTTQFSRRCFFPSAALILTHGSPATTVVISARDGKVVSTSAHARQLLAPPGSTVKPVTLTVLLHTGKLGAMEVYLCPGALRLGSHNMNCTHPRLGRPLQIAELIAYSCNCGIAHFAERFAAGELAGSLQACGFFARQVGGSEQQLQALGEDYVTVTPFNLAEAYRRFSDPVIVAGLEGAVRFGTAQAASLPNVSVAGKTGSVRTSTGMHAAWFAGFAPSRNPQFAVSVFIQGSSGGADAAPIARELLRRYCG